MQEVHRYFTQLSMEEPPVRMLLFPPLFLQTRHQWQQQQQAAALAVIAVAAAGGSNSSTLSNNISTPSSSTLSVSTYSLVSNPLHEGDCLDVSVAELLCDANADLNHLNSEGDSAMVRVWLRKGKC